MLRLLTLDDVTNRARKSVRVVCVGPSSSEAKSAYVFVPIGNFVMSVRTGNLLYTAGHLPISVDGELTTGKVNMAG